MMIDRQRLKASLLAEPTADFVEEDGAPGQILTPAAVLFPIVRHPARATVLLTQRTAHLRDHAGQVSFPGGRVEAVDTSPIETALRESEEEIGLPREQVEILGFLPEYRTGTGFRVTPVVALVEPPLVLHPDPFEVAEVFEVPLAFLLDPANHQQHAAHYRGALRHYYAMPYDGHFIWGATAGMIRSLSERWGRQDAPPCGILTV
ncbi:MAG: CoA pyrophosphatase [Azonexus sp.]|jgi:8-oxo-dGTP pyrophosphatase MutT (NUDIX family)|nr:CoA pyrophosphatase [Azonexus sp.]